MDAASPVETYDALVAKVNSLDGDRVVLISPSDCVSLVGLTAPDLAARNVGSPIAEEICDALDRADLNPLARHLGIFIVIKLDSDGLTGNEKRGSSG